MPIIIQLSQDTGTPILGCGCQPVAPNTAKPIATLHTQDPTPDDRGATP